MIRVFPSRLSAVVCFFLGALVLHAQTPVLLFPHSEDRGGYLNPTNQDIGLSKGIEPSESVVAYFAEFDAALARNPISSYPNIPWETPLFHGGYLLETTNDSDADYFPNFIRFVTSPAAGRGYLSFSLTKIFGPGSSGQVTNSIFGALVTETEIEGDGEFRMFVTEIAIDHPGTRSAGLMLRGVVFDGARWLVTADAAVLTEPSATYGWVSTRPGWYELDTADFSYRETLTSPSGPITRSGVWFLASETASGDDAGFTINLSDAYFTARPPVVRYTVDTDEDGRVSLQELLRVIELYNTRAGSSRTGRYTPAEDTPDGYAPDSSSAAGSPALFARYHGSDSDRDGTVSLGELLRVIEIYNTRAGTTRTGRYRLDATTVDGIAPDLSDG
ncbi:MAG: hypothetical protein SynsKO_18730 [Synoicihabitans sp.]